MVNDIVNLNDEVNKAKKEEEKKLVNLSNIILKFWKNLILEMIYCVNCILSQFSTSFIAKNFSFSLLRSLMTKSSSFEFVQILSLSNSGICT